MMAFKKKAEKEVKKEAPKKSKKVEGVQELNHGSQTIK